MNSYTLHFIDSFLESIDGGGGELLETLSTPIRAARTRRTRSMTRSPSPVKIEEINPMDTVVEEDIEPQSADVDAEVVEIPIVASELEVVHEKPLPITSVTPTKTTTLSPSNKSKKSPLVSLKRMENTTEPSEHERDSLNVKLDEVKYTNVEPESSTEDITEPEPSNVMETDGCVESAATNDQENIEMIETESATPAEGVQSNDANAAAANETTISSTDKKDDRKRRHTRSRSTSPSSSTATTTASKRTRPMPAQNIEDFTNDEDEPDFNGKAVLLSWCDSDLHLKVNSSEFLSARPISDGALCLAYAGVRATHGVAHGKVVYEVQVNDSNRLTSMQNEKNLFDLRCGWSTRCTDLQLGESPLSFGYGGVGKKVVGNVFTDYGRKFGSRGDVIGVYLDLDSTPCKIEYTVNGEKQGVAFQFDKSELGGKALYPHILTRNIAFRVNFGQLDKLLVNELRPRKEDRRDSGSRRSGSDRRRDRDSKHDRSRDQNDDKVATEEKVVDETVAAPPLFTEKESEKIVTENPSVAAVVVPSEEAVVPTPTDETIAVASKEVSKTNDELPMEEQSIKSDEVEEKSIEAVATVNREEKEDLVVAANAQNDDVLKKKELVSEDMEMKEEEKSTDEIVERFLLQDYQLIGKLAEEVLVPGLERPETRKECEVILMIGLPGAGKTHWANAHAAENADRNYQILGLQSLLDKMKVSVIFLHQFK